jgi:ferredoxin
LISRHGTDITYWAYVVSGVILAGSLVIMMPFCRWLCPLAAVLNPLSRVGLARVHRDEQSCRSCGACAKHCPMAIPVDEVRQVTAARCISCLNCLQTCPTAKNKEKPLRWGLPRPISEPWSQAALVAALVFCLSGAVTASYLFPLPSFVKQRGTMPGTVEWVDLRMDDLTCRGRANLLFYFLERDDLFAVSGYLRLEAWPGPGRARARVGFDPAQTDAQRIKQAVSQPYYDALADVWRNSPFTIEGYDPLELDAEMLLDF